MCLLVCFWLLFDILESVASTSSWLWVETGVLCSPCKTRKDCFQVSRCTLLVNELKETKAWVPWTRLQAEGFPGMPEGLLLHPVLGLIALFQPWRFCRAGIGPAAISAGTAAASKSRRAPLACAVQLLAGRLVPPMGSGSLFIILLMSVSCSVSVKGRSLLEWRSTFLHKQKRLCDRIAGTWQDIDRGGVIGAAGWFAVILGCLGSLCCSWHQRSIIQVPHQEYLFAGKQPFCSFFLSDVFQVNLQQISLSAFPHHICLLEGSSWKKKNRMLLVFESSSSSLPSPSSLSSLVPASWRRKEHINPKTALQPFLRYLPRGANWNWIRQGYQVCWLW